MTDADPKAIAYAAAFVGAAVSLVTAVLVTWLNDRSEARRQREGAAREDRREAERAVFLTCRTGASPPIQSRCGLQNRMQCWRSPLPGSDRRW